jgi:hypothetical protein
MGGYALLAENCLNKPPISLEHFWPSNGDAKNIGGIGFRRLKAPKFDTTNPSLNTLLVRNSPSRTNPIILFQ